jgi:hypothetical protein
MNEFIYIPVVFLRGLRKILIKNFAYLTFLSFVIFTCYLTSSLLSQVSVSPYASLFLILPFVYGLVEVYKAGLEEEGD